MDKRDLEKRSKQFALRIIKFVASLPENQITNVMGYQLLKAGTSVGANYREANRAESRNDFIHKIGVVEKEASESQYWLELFDEADISDVTERRWLLQESGELFAIFVASGRTAKANRNAQRR
ncbi:MAG TPA: four helix bundle protein [Caldilineae bacterium]|nr:four helix bundle protein [Caldilineae bacterium]